MDGLLELAARCEAASEADRELDDAIATAVFRFAGMSQLVDVPDDQQFRTFAYADGSIGSSLRYTASLDAAMTLVPEGWAFSLGEMMGLPVERRWRCHLRDHREPYNPATCAWLDRECRTPALAICAAALRARAASN